MRAHANCVENLPVFGAIVLALYVSGIGGATVNGVCVGILAARIVQSLVHVSLVQTNTVVSVRFAFYFAQIVGFVCLTAIVVSRAA